MARHTPTPLPVHVDQQEDGRMLVRCPAIEQAVTAAWTLLGTDAERAVFIDAVHADILWHLRAISNAPPAAPRSAGTTIGDVHGGRVLDARGAFGRGQP